jgi:pimeloyl-ACP methyl ester carboxylesterase
MSRTIVLIHGAWLTPASWEPFRERYEGRGFATLAPPWPLEDLPLEDLRRAPPPGLGRLTIGRIVDRYEDVIRGLSETPIIMGHSYGGLFTQLLLDRGLGVAGVAFDPAPIRGVVPRPRTLLSALPVFLSWRSWSRVVTMSLGQFATNFAQTLPDDEKRLAWERWVIGTPGRLYWQGALGIGTGIQARNPKRAPLLLVAGEEDRTIVPAMVRATYRKQRRAPSLTAFKTFPGRSHFLCTEPGWEEVADYALAWVLEHLGAARPAPRSRAVGGRGVDEAEGAS